MTEFSGKDAESMGMQPKKIKVDYVALFFRDWLPDLMMMTPEVRGAYCSLCFKIYDDGGALPNNIPTLASIAGFSELDFTRVWEVLKPKFLEKNGQITHKRCTMELQRAYKQIQARSRAGLTAAKARWNHRSVNNANALPSQSETMPRERDETRTRRDKNINTNTNTKSNLQQELQRIEERLKPSTSDSIKNSSIASDSSRTNPGQQQSDMMFLNEALRGFFSIKTNGDRTCLENISRWAATKIAVGHRDREFLKQIIALAEESRKEARRNRWGYFMNVLRRDYGYIPPTKQKVR
jgi:uncharacterized protein YdaU (DUF1376 family)